ncbi:MAG TPA: TetR/AcrR family transcriptional regulator [Streptosporangiaceae bacterium]|jgi:AcrR family transcriptional regulator
MTKTAARRSAVGRPRANPVVGTGVDPRGEILSAAARLFTSVGFAAATTHQIAAAVGLRQASLFHHFARKEDILAALLDQTVEPSLRYAERLAAAGLPADVAIYLLVRSDLGHYCSGAGNLGSLQIQPEARRERFADFWAKRDQLRDIYQDIIARGQAVGVFAVTDLTLATNIVFGLVEATATWFRQDGDAAPDTVFDKIAQFALRGLLPEATSPESDRAAEQRARTIAAARASLVDPEPGALAPGSGAALPA